MIPIFVALHKSLNNHEHIVCSESLAHFHQDNNSCVLCEFNFSNFDLDINSNYSTLNKIPLHKSFLNYSVSFFNSSIANFDLRGPPSYS